MAFDSITDCEHLEKDARKKLTEIAWGDDKRMKALASKGLELCAAIRFLLGEVEHRPTQEYVDQLKRRISELESTENAVKNETCP